MYKRLHLLLCPTFLEAVFWDTMGEAIGQGPFAGTADRSQLDVPRQNLPFISQRNVAKYEEQRCEA
jgi:hypothetical protein